MRFLILMLAAGGLLPALFGGCSDWSSLYGTDCRGELIANGVPCAAEGGNVSPGGTAGWGGQLSEGGSDGGGEVELSCGNGVVEIGEVCDDGNREGDDSCLAGCSWATCGDGFQRRGVEDCDDGNVANGDGCAASCLVCGQEGSYLRHGTGHCYVLHEEELTQEEASVVCGQEGGYLLATTNSTEAGLVKRQLRGDTQEFWLGFKLEEGTRTWVTRESYGNLPWVSGEPTALECTVQFGTETSDQNFRSISCDEKRPFICENEPARTNPSTHHAYRRWFIDTTQEGAMEYCAAAGGALVSIESEEERSYLSNVFKTDFWTLGQRSDAATYSWGDHGDAVNPEMFSPDADVSPGNDCLYSSGGQLMAGPCSDERALVCEFL